jgi:hypothetical protein
MFFAFDGSRSFMDRDGARQEYEQFSVPREVEAEWLAELTDSYLQSLGSPGNWRAVHFFRNHHDCGHLGALTNARPRGVLWERTAYLEHLLDYVAMCRSGTGGTNEARASVEHVISEASRLRAACRADRTRKRVDALVEKAQRTLRS